MLSHSEGETRKPVLPLHPLNNNVVQPHSGASLLILAIFELLAVRDGHSIYFNGEAVSHRSVPALILIPYN